MKEIRGGRGEVEGERGEELEAEGERKNNMLMYGEFITHTINNATKCHSIYHWSSNNIFCAFSFVVFFGSRSLYIGVGSFGNNIPSDGQFIVSLCGA